MYTKEELSKYPYFEKLLDGDDIIHHLDSLTNVLSRRDVADFAVYLIEKGIPFTYGMLDIDNFKFINDTYGHKTGDAVLKALADGMEKHMSGFGVVGRFGGDELLFIDLEHIEYEQKKEFFGGLYGAGGVLRKNIDVSGFSPFVTATVGCATYPYDAKDHNGLFELIDKTLYRGKTKGRNCYIIYVEEKHKDIEISHIARRGIYTSMHSLVRQFETVPGIKNKFASVLPLLIDEMKISDLYYAGEDCVMHSVIDRGLEEKVTDVGRVLSNDVYFANDPSLIREISPCFYGMLEKHGIESFMVVKVSMGVKAFGYLILAECRSKRIWQEEETALMYFLAKLLAATIMLTGERL